MYVTNIKVLASPLAEDRSRLQAEVAHDDRSIPREIYWFDVPGTHAKDLTASGNPWLVLLLPLAVNLGESLRIPRPVDPELLANAHELMRVWHCWYPHLRPVAVEADVCQVHSNGSEGLTASMFSGGVDAWFTLLSNNGADRHPGARKIDEVLCIWGFDIGVDRPNQFRSMRSALADATSGLGVKFTDVATNVRQTQWWNRSNWGHMAHGSGLASIALAMEGRYSRLLIPSSHRYDDLSPWGSHPLTDPLLSSQATRIFHDGAGFSRVEKTAAIAKSDAALKSLQVCWYSNDFTNCGACVKCYRTMATLHLLGALDACPRLPGADFKPARLARIFSQRESQRVLLREVRNLAVERQRFDVAKAIDRSFLNSRWIGTALWFTEFLSKLPLLWRLSAPLKWRLQERYITKG